MKESRNTPLCFYCSQAENDIDPRDGDPVELRPYGPQGAPLCFNCMMAYPGREAEAKRQFVSQLDAAGSIVVIGEPTGPRPLDGGKDA